MYSLRSSSLLWHDDLISRQLIDGRHRDSRMTFNVYLVLLVSVTALLVEYLVLACNIEDARNTPDGLVRDWSGVAVDDPSVVELKQTVVNDAIVAKAHHVIESYQQVTSVMRQFSLL